MTESVKTGVIPRFEGEYFFLSNFYEAEPFTWRNHQFRTAEHAFQWAKGFHLVDAYLGDMIAYSEATRDAPTPSKAKYEGRKAKIDVDGWDSMRINYMREIVHAKFSQVKGLAGSLLNTGACLLVEGNDWGDKFWGRCLDKDTGKMVGLNTLGTILMETRGYWLHHQFTCPNCNHVL